MPAGFAKICVRNWFFRLLAFLLCSFSLLMNTSAVGFAHLSDHVLPHTTLAPYTVSGTVFDDYNQNGIQDTREPGLNGVVVTAYDKNNAVVTTATTSTSAGISGVYSLLIPAATGPVRLEFSNYGPNSTDDNLKLFQTSNHAGGTEEAFVSGASTTNTVNLGLEIPGEYCQNASPDVAVTCFTKGDQTVNAHVVVRFPYTASGDNTPPGPLASAPDVGSTFGIAYRPSTDTLFVAAYMRRHAGFKPGGSPGSIYSISNADTSTPDVSPTPFFDFNAPGSSTTAGPDEHTPGSDDYQLDAGSFDAVGKVSLGGMALSQDQQFLYVLNLYDKKLYAIYIGQASSQPFGTAAAGYILPRPSNCVEDDFRPFAVATYRNSEYVGAVCSAELTITQALPHGDPAALHAYVYKYTLGSGFVPTPVLQFPLNYPRHCANDTQIPACVTQNSANWNPWTPTYQSLALQPSLPSYPQPMLTGLAFDRGDMLIGLRDRFGDQTGYNTPAPDNSTYISGVASGDLLRACLTTPEEPSGGWTLENNASCGSSQTAGANNGRGPGNGEYYFQNNYPQYHDHISLGTLIQVPGFPGTMNTAFDPTDTVFSGGTQTYDNVTGALTNSYRVYDSSVSGTFGKANGLGGIVALCHSAPVEIGHRVWLDNNSNGIQDANEPPIVGATVHLYAADGHTLLHTTTTDSNGNYYFTVPPYVDYVVKLDNPVDYAPGGPLYGNGLTTMGQGSDILANSKAYLPTTTSPIGPHNYPQMDISSLIPGGNTHTYDVGFTPPPDLSITKTHPVANYQAGQNITFTLTVTNAASAGPVVAGPITVTDTLPAGLSNISVSGTTWNFSTVAPSIRLSQTHNHPHVGQSGLPVSSSPMTPHVGQSGLPVSGSPNQRNPRRQSASHLRPRILTL